MTRSAWRPTRNLLPVLLVIGVLDMAGNAGYIAAVQTGALAIASVVSALYPVTTVILAAVFLHERVTRSHAVGIALAVRRGRADRDRQRLEPVALDPERLHGLGRGEDHDRIEPFRGEPPVVDGRPHRGQVPLDHGRVHDPPDPRGVPCHGRRSRAGPARSR